MTAPSNQGPYAPEHSVPTPPSLQSNRSVIVVLVILAGLILFRENISKALGWGGSENVELKEQLANLQDKLDVLNTAKQLRDEELRVAINKMEEAKYAAKTTVNAIDKMETELNRWVVTKKEIESTELGQRIAADSSLVEIYLTLLEKELPDQDFAKHLRDRIESLMQPLNEAIEINATYSPNSNLIQGIEGLKTQANEARQSIEQLNSHIQAVLLRAPAKPSEATLVEAIDNLKKRYAANQADLISKAVTEAREQGQQKLADVQAELQRVKDAQQAEAIRREAELRDSQLVKVRSHNEALAAFEKDEATIGQYLKSLTTPAYTQLDRSRFKAVADKQPISFSALNMAGCLIENVEGLKKLAGVIQDQDNTRPNTLPIDSKQRLHSGEAHVVDAVKTTQELLLKHSAILIEKGMLKE
jgi:hypothetical protein